MILLVFLCTFIGIESFPLFPNNNVLFDNFCDYACQEYLIKYDYIYYSNKNSNNLVHLDDEDILLDELKQGIINLQKDAGLEETGIMDENTIKIMNTTRCGVSSSFNQRIKRFVTFKSFNNIKN